MILSTKIRILKKYCGSSKFDFWNNIDEDHILRVCIELKPVCRGRSGLHSPSITVFNDSLIPQKFTDGWNNVVNYLSKIEYKEVL